MSKSILALVLSIVVLSSLAISQTVVFAEGSNNETEVITPNIEVDEEGWLIVSYGGKVKDKEAAALELDAFVANALYKMHSASRDEYTLLRGTNYIQDYEDENFGNSYVRGWFGTHASWTSSPASFWGSSSSWFGTEPDDTCDIGVDHYLEPSELEGYINDVPTAWEPYSSYQWAGSGMYTVYDDWYLGTSWSGVKASYPYTISMYQITTSGFGFPGINGPVTEPSFYLNYGE